MSPRRPSPLSIRLTAEERAALEARAAGLPLGAYIKSAALGDAAPLVRQSRAPIRDAQALSRVLALLGRSHLSSNLNQLAKAAHMGALPVTEDVEKALREACADVRLMRVFLLAALGIKTTAALPALRQLFADAAADGAP